MEAEEDGAVQRKEGRCQELCTKSIQIEHSQGGGQEDEQDAQQDDGQEDAEQAQGGAGQGDGLGQEEDGGWIEETESVLAWSARPGWKSSQVNRPGEESLTLNIEQKQNDKSGVSNMSFACVSSMSVSRIQDVNNLFFTKCVQLM